MKTHFILYVADQEAARAFYARVLGREADLHVPGMTEFSLGPDTVLGLMPRAGVERLLGSAMRPADPGSGGARAEIYLLVDDPAGCHERARAAGARELSPLQARNWGHEAAYSVDPDGYVVAFAREIDSGIPGDS